MKEEGLSEETQRAARYKLKLTDLFIHGGIEVYVLRYTTLRPIITLFKFLLC